MSDISKIKITNQEYEIKDSVARNSINEVQSSIMQSDWENTDSKSTAYISNKPNIKNGDGANSILIGEGDANGKYSIAGGTNDKDLIGDLAGDLSSIIGSVEVAKADGDMSMSFGAGTVTRTAGTMAIGANSKAGIKGFYFTKVSGNTLTLSTKQPTILSSSAKWDTNAQTQLNNWKSGDTITIVNDANYVMCSKITSISNTASAASITVDALPFTSKASVLLPILNDFSVINHDKPDAGVIGLGLGSVSMGLKNEAHGLFSLAEGRENLAAGNYAHAEGMMTKAGHTSHAEGYKTNAKGSYSHAENSNTTSSGENSHAEGLHTESGGTNSHAEGNGAKAMGLNSHAEGCNSEVTGESSHVEGLNVKVHGNDSHGEGYQNTIEATASHAHVEGARNVVKAISAHAEGDSTIAASFAQHVQGKYNVEDASDSYAHIVGGGSSDTDRKNIHTIDWDGNAVYTGTVIASNGQLISANDVPQSDWNVTDSSSNAYIKNKPAIESGTGYMATVIGENNTSTGARAVASGFISKATKDDAHAFGYGATASGAASFATGESTASGRRSFSSGVGTVAQGYCQTVEGEYNLIDATQAENVKARGEYIHIAGNGTSNTARSNAHTLDWEGNAWYAGVITVGSNRQKLATEDFVLAQSSGVVWKSM